MSDKILIDKKLFIAVILIPTILIILSSLFIYQVILNKGLNSNSKLNLKEEEITSTGYIPKELSDEENNMIDEETTLLNMLPIETENFNVEFNYELDKFQVISEDPELAPDDLNNWLEENNLGEIPPERFI